MPAAIVTEILDQSFEADQNGYYHQHCVLSDGTKISVRAQSMGKWNAGDQVEYEIRGESQYPGPDAQEDWTYGAFKRPGGGRGQGGPRNAPRATNGGTPRPTPQRGQIVAPRASVALPAVSLTDASEVFDAIAALTLSEVEGAKDEMTPGEMASLKIQALFQAWSQGKTFTMAPKPAQVKENGAVNDGIVF